MNVDHVSYTDIGSTSLIRLKVVRETEIYRGKSFTYIMLHLEPQRNNIHHYYNIKTHASAL